MAHDPATTRRSLLIAASAAAATSAFAAAPADPRLYGVWNGVLRSGSVSMRVRLILTPDQPATLVSLDEGSTTRQASQTSLDGSQVDIRFAGVFARFKGRLVGDQLVGRWRQLINDLPLSLDRGEGGGARAPAGGALTPELLSQWRRKAETPGIGAAAQRGSGSRLRLVDGLRCSREAIPVTVNDQWHWGSITKSMTATLIARHVESGDLSWDDTIEGVLGSRVGTMSPAYGPVTLLELLSHRSGLPANLGAADQGGLAQHVATNAIADRLAYATAALGQRPRARRQEDFLYSNSGYVVAAAMLEARTGWSWESLMRKRLFEPLGLTSAGFGAPGHPGALDQPLGHFEPNWTWRDGRPRNPVELNGKRAPDNIPALGPAGRVHMNLSDMLDYLTAHRDLSEQLMSKASWRRLHTPPFAGDYALGWIVKPDGGLWHNGSNTLWYGEVQVDPSQGIVAAAVANDGVEDVTFGLVSRVLFGAMAAVA